ncbi:hypothetical protein Tco_0513877 [Tanacetum coccineum]
MCSLPCYKKPNEAFNEAWEVLRTPSVIVLHHGFSELHQLDTFYNSLNSKNDQVPLDSAAAFCTKFDVLCNIPTYFKFFNKQYHSKPRNESKALHCIGVSTMGPPISHRGCGKEVMVTKDTELPARRHPTSIRRKQTMTKKIEEPSFVANKAKLICLTIEDQQTKNS